MPEADSRINWDDYLRLWEAVRDSIEHLERLKRELDISEQHFPKLPEDDEDQDPMGE